VKPPKR